MRGRRVCEEDPPRLKHASRPTCRVLSGAGLVASNTQSSVIKSTRAPRSRRLNASWNLSIVSRASSSIAMTSPCHRSPGSYKRALADHATRWRRGRAPTPICTAVTTCLPRRWLYPPDLRLRRPRAVLIAPRMTVNRRG
jgi:hypothetical protein